MLEPATVVKRARTPRWHRLYLLLAAFDVLTVCASLYLNHRLIEIHTAYLVIAGQFADLRRLAGAANAPGNDVFDTHDVPSERARDASSGTPSRASSGVSTVDKRVDVVDDADDEEEDADDIGVAET